MVLIGALSLAAATGAGWRSRCWPRSRCPRRCGCATGGWRSRRRRPTEVARGRLPRAFWVAAAMLFCTIAAEWCITAWGASFVEDAAGVSADTAVALMFGSTSACVAGACSAAGSRARHAPHRLLALALAVTAAGFAVLWPAASPAQALAGLLVVGLGLGNLFPLGLAVTVALAADRAQFAVQPRGAGGRRRGAARAADGRRARRRDSLTAALAVVPVMLALRRGRADARDVYSMRSKPPASTKSSRPVRQPRTESRTSGVGRSR